MLWLSKQKWRESQLIFQQESMQHIPQNRIWNQRNSLWILPLSLLFPICLVSLQIVRQLVRIMSTKLGKYKSTISTTLAFSVKKTKKEERKLLGWSCFLTKSLVQTCCVEGNTYCFWNNESTEKIPYCIKCRWNDGCNAVIRSNGYSHHPV